MLQSLKNLRVLPWTHCRVVNLRWFSDDEKFDKKEKLKNEKPREKPKEKVLKSKDAADRLNALLESMSSKNIRSEIKIQTAPKKKPKPQKAEEKSEEKLKVITAAIAKKIGGDVQKTESELLNQLLGIKDVKHSANLSELISGMKVDEEGKRKPARREREPERNDRDRGRNDREHSRNDRDGGRNDRDGGRNDRDGGRNDRDGRGDGGRNDREQYSRADNVRRSVGPPRDRNFQRRPDSGPASVVNLFGGEPLGIFTKASDAVDPLETWSKLEKRELKLAVTHPPSNYFEKMIIWTDQGKLWKFPIDNEQGLEEEKEADFSEHVLLEMFLDGWCPSSGPVRHFMELVCVGLSKNHHLTAKEKKDHILWYRDYFGEKQDLLGDLMTMGKVESPKLEA